MRDKIRAALTADEFKVFDKLCKDAVEMYQLINDRVNRDTREEFAAMIGEENVPPEWKTICDLEWTERANAVLGEPKDD